MKKNLKLISDILKLIFLFVNIIILSACSGGGSTPSKYLGNREYQSLSRHDPRNSHYKGHYKIGNEYRIKNKSYRPKEVTRYSKVGIASWYGKRYGFHGNETANGDVYNKNLLTAAHKTLPLPSLVKVRNLSNGRSIILLVNDRGPFSRGREIDLSERAADILDIKKKGTAKVKVDYLHAESMNFLKTLGLQKRHGSRAKSPLQNEKCSVNCHIQLVNLRHKKRLKRG